MLRRSCFSWLPIVCALLCSSVVTNADEQPLPSTEIAPVPLPDPFGPPGVQVPFAAPRAAAPLVGPAAPGMPVAPGPFAAPVASDVPVAPDMPMVMPVAGHQGTNWSPPGTLGETYTRPSHAIPVDEHPRTAMLAIRDKATTPIITVQRMGGFRMKSGVWLFESERPLDHGRCQIVRVEGRKTVQDIEPFSTKFVRLIPGRIVYLDF